MCDRPLTTEEMELELKRLEIIKLIVEASVRLVDIAGGAIQIVAHAVNTR